MAVSIFDRIRNGFSRKAAPAISYGVGDPALAELFGAVSATAAAISVTPDTALRCPPVMAAIRSIADLIAGLPIRLVRREADGSRAPDLAHPVARLLEGDWCGWLSSAEARRQITVDALTTDLGGVGLVTRIDGQPREIVRLPPGTVSVAYSALGEPSCTLATTEGQRILDPADVVHVPSPFSRYPNPRSPVSLAREAIALCLAMELHAGRLMGRSARPGGVIERGEATPRKGPEAESKESERFNSAWGARRAGETLILPVGFKFTPLEFKSVDLQFLELRKFQVEEIARAFGVPPHRLYELGRATWSNVSDMGREFVDYTLAPWIRTWEAALSRALLTAEERAVYCVELDSDDLALPSLADQAAAYSALIAARVISPNEARGWMSLAAYEGGDEFANPNVMTGREPAPQPKNPGEPK